MIKYSSIKMIKGKFLLVIAGFLPIFLISCQEPPKKYNRPVEGVKFTDIKPLYRDYDPFPSKFSVEVIIRRIQIPATNYNSLKQLWASLSTDKMNFTDKELFLGNGFQIGRIIPKDWDMVKEVLKSLNAEITDTATLIIDQSMGTDYKIKKVLKPENYFYKTLYNQFEVFYSLPGSPAWHISVFENPKLSETAKLVITPKFVPFEDIKGDMTETFGDMKVSFYVESGYTVILYPDIYDPQINQLKNLFFYRQAPIPTVDIFLISCGKIF